MLQFMRSQRVRHDWATELNWTALFTHNHGFFSELFPKALLRMGPWTITCDHRTAQFLCDTIPGTQWLEEGCHSHLLLIKKQNKTTLSYFLWHGLRDNRSPLNSHKQAHSTTGSAVLEGRNCPHSHLVIGTSCRLRNGVSWDASSLFLFSL